jgi:hypothetical protein
MTEPAATPPKATLTPITDANGTETAGEPVKAHFNPESLQLTIRNTMEAKDGETNGRPPQQLVSASEVSLALQLLFDTTMTGADVRGDTAKIAEMMRPGAVEQGSKRRPAVVRFEWGQFRFQGTITDYAETIDFFSADGVPLRSSLNLTITKHEDAFPQPKGGPAAGVGAGSVPSVAQVPAGASMSELARRGGAPQAGSTLGAANAEENFRNPEADEVASPEAAFAAGAAAGAFGSPLSAGAGAGAGVGLSFGRPPAAFASGAAGLGIDLGISAEAGAGLAAGASLGGGIGLEAGAGLGAGLSASAGVSAFELDAFAGLQAPAPVLPGASLGGGISFDLPEAPAIGAGLSAGAGVSLGGAAGFGLGVGLGGAGGAVASVGKEIDLASILFAEE